MDKFLDEAEAVKTPSASSAENKPEGEETPTSEPAGAEPDTKTEQVKEVEADSSLSPEEKLAKVKEILGDDEEAIDAYIKSKGYHKDPAWQKQRELIERLKQEVSQKSALSDEDKNLLEEMKKITSSPEYIQTSMKAQGYTQEAINKVLREKGFDVPSQPSDDLTLVSNKLGLDPSMLTDEQKVWLTDTVKVAKVIVQDMLDKVLPSQLKPLQEHISEITRTSSADKLTDKMKSIVKEEEILDFEKDIEPELHKFLDSNPDATQEEVFDYFKTLNHRLSIERLRAGGKKKEREIKKGNLRANITPGASPLNLPEKTGDFDKDADAFLDAMGVRE